jgi:hypothetical protein
MRRPRRVTIRHDEQNERFCTGELLRGQGRRLAALPESVAGKGGKRDTPHHSPCAPLFPATGDKIVQLPELIYSLPPDRRKE